MFEEKRSIYWGLNESSGSSEDNANEVLPDGESWGGDRLEVLADTAEAAGDTAMSFVDAYTESVDNVVEAVDSGISSVSLLVTGTDEGRAERELEREARRTERREGGVDAGTRAVGLVTDVVGSGWDNWNGWAEDNREFVGEHFDSLTDTIADTAIGRAYGGFSDALTGTDEGRARRRQERDERAMDRLERRQERNND